MKKFLCVAMASLISLNPGINAFANRTALNDRASLDKAVVDAAASMAQDPSKFTQFTQGMYFVLGIIDQSRDIYERYLIPCGTVLKKAYYKITDDFIKDPVVLNKSFNKLFSKIKGQEEAKRSVRGAAMAIADRINRIEQKIAQESDIKGNIIYLTGPSGVGKSMMAKAIANAFLGDRVSQQCLTVNPSSLGNTDERNGGRNVKEQLFSPNYYCDNSKTVVGDFLDFHSNAVVVLEEYDKFFTKGTDEVLRGIMDEAKIKRGARGDNDCQKVVFIITSNEKRESLFTGKNENQEKENNENNEEEKLSKSDQALIAISGLLNQGAEANREDGRTNTEHDPSLLKRFNPICFESLENEDLKEIISNFINDKIEYYKKTYGVKLICNKDCIDKMLKHAKDSNKEARATNDLEEALSAEFYSHVADCWEQDGGENSFKRTFTLEYDAKEGENGKFKMTEIKDDFSESDEYSEEEDIDYNVNEVDDEDSESDSCHSCKAATVAITLLAGGTAAILALLQK